MKLKDIYKDLISEGRSTEISRDEFISYLESDGFGFNYQSTKIYRTITGFDADFGIIRPKKAETKRKSENTANYYTLIIDNSDNWSEYPKRSESVICSVNDRREYVVIPKLQGNVGICSSSDMWFSFKDFESVERGFNEALNSLYLYSQEKLESRMKRRRKVSHIEALIPDDTFSEFRSVIENMDNTIKTDSNKSYEDYLDTVEDYSKKKLVKMFLDSNFNEFYGFLEYVLDPDRNGFKRRYYSLNFNVTVGRTEVWTDAPCLLVKRQYLMSALRDTHYIN